MTNIKKICHRCDGQGQVDTGIDESPVTVCNYCNGTGVNPFYQAGFDAAMAQQPKQEPVAYSHTQMKIIAESNYDAGYKKGVKNAHAKQEQGEPVAWMFQHEETGRIVFVETQQLEWGFEKGNPRLKKIAPLYTTPQQRKPLTDAMVSAAARVLSDRQAEACGVDKDDQWKIYGQDFIEDACAMLKAAHGIKE